MAVVQRIQRLYPFQFEPAFGRVAQPGSRPSAIGWRQIGSQTACAGGLLAADLLAFGIAVAGACNVSAWVQSQATSGNAASSLALAASALAGMLGYFMSHEHYEHRVPFWTECRDILRATGAALVLAATAAFLLNLPEPRLPLLTAALLFPPAVLAMRGLTRRALTAAGLWRLPVVIVGDGAWSAQAEVALRAEPSLGYDVVGHASSSALRAGLGDGAPYEGFWRGLLLQHQAKLLILAHDTEGSLPPSIVADLVRERVPYALLPKLDGLPVIGARHTYLGRETVLVSYRNNLRKPLARAAKMTFDVVVAAAALVILAPPMLVVAALVGLDGGPVFYAHTRIGARGKVFRCLKFRSMVTDSEAALQALFTRDPLAAEEWTRTHKLRLDPRVTWVGRMLRKTSLDELPQLFNVLRLDMSLVGPRPIVSLEIPKYAEDIAYYYETRPGITGLWQVSGRSDTTYAQRVRLDSWYVKNWSIWQDFSIIARTIPAVLSGRGAG